MESGDLSVAADAEQILITPDEEDDEEDEETNLNNDQEFQNVLADAFGSDEDSEDEVEEIGDDIINEDSLYEREGSSQLNQSCEIQRDFRLGYQQRPVDESVSSSIGDKSNSKEEIVRAAARYEFKDFHGDGNEQYANQYLGGYVKDEEQENENSNKLMAYLTRNGENLGFSEVGNERDAIRPEILNAAKDRQIEKLRKELADRTHNWQTENAALTQRLIEAEEAHANLESEFQGCENALETANIAGLKLQDELKMVNGNFEALRENKDRILTKLKIAEDTIESLHHQLKGLQSSESMTRARENHLKTINNMEENHQTEIRKYNEEIGNLREALIYKEEEVNNLSERLDEVRSELEGVKLEKLKTVNKLIEDLEVNQENYQKLLKSKENQKVSEDHKLLIDNLKEELTNVKQERDAYRSASKLNSVVNSKPGKVSSDGLPAYPQDSLMSNLKNELENMLTTLRVKNDELQKLKTDLRNSESQVRLSREQSLKNESSILDYQDKIKTLTKELNQLKLTSEASSSFTSKDRRALKNELETLKVQLRESEQTVEQLSALKEKMDELAINSREEMRKMSQDHERDKNAALNECKQYYSELHSDASQIERQKAAKSLKDQQQQYEMRLKKLTSELTEVKQLYMEVCKEKDGIYERFEAEKKKWVKEKELETETKKKEISEEVSKQVGQKVKQAKQLWETEQSTKIEENVLAKAKELLQHYQSEKISDSAEKEMEDYLDHIKELETRVKETEEAFQKHLQGCEASRERQKVKELDELEAKLRAEHEIILRDATAALRIKFEREKQSLKASLSAENSGGFMKKLLESSREQFKDLNAALENQREEMAREFEERGKTEKIKLIAEINLENQKLIQDRLQKLKQELEKEKTQALAEQETHLCKELENFLVAQKQRFLDALNVMQESQAKEKTELRKYYDEIVSRLNAECQQRLEAKDSEIKSFYRDEFGKHEEERSLLLEKIESLKEKCARLESEKASLTSKIQLELKATKLELEECRSRLEQNEADWAGRREELVVNPLRKEMATLRAKAGSAEDQAAQLRLQLEASSMECKATHDKYVILKEKVKKYHRYVHGKEKEYTENLIKMNAEHKLSIDKIANMRDAAQAVENRFEEIYNLVLTKDGSNAGSKNGPSHIPNNKMFPEPNHVHQRENEMLKATIEKFHGDIMKFIKLQEEMTKASLDFYAHVKGGSAAPPASKQTSVYGGSRSGTATPEPHTNGSSGRGTMVGNSAGSASEGGGGNEMYRSKPLKFWSSTPFHPCEARFGNDEASKSPATITPLNYGKMKQSDEWPVSLLGQNSQRMSAQEEEEEQEEDSDDYKRINKLKILTEQILGREAHSGFNSASSLNHNNSNKPVMAMDPRSNLKLTSDLTALKNEFWKSVNGNV